MLAVLAAILLLVSAPGLAAPVAEAGLDSHFSMHLIPLPGNAAISAYEPVVMALQTTNISSETVSLPAWTTEYTMQIDIRDDQGLLVGALQKKEIPGDFLYSAHKLKPGETLESLLIFSRSIRSPNPVAMQTRPRRGRLHPPVV